MKLMLLVIVMAIVVSAQTVPMTAAQLHADIDKNIVLVKAWKKAHGVGNNWIQNKLTRTYVDTKRFSPKRVQADATLVKILDRIDHDVQLLQTAQ